MQAVDLATIEDISERLRDKSEKVARSAALHLMKIFRCEFSSLCWLSVGADQLLKVQYMETLVSDVSQLFMK